MSGCAPETQPPDESYDVTLRPVLPDGADVSVRRYRSGQSLVIEAIGEIDMGVAPSLRKVLRGVSSARLVFDLRKVSFMDASALAVLAEAWHRAKPEGGWVKIVGPCDRVRKLLTLTRLDVVLPVYESLEEAAC